MNKKKALKIIPIANPNSKEVVHPPANSELEFSITP